MASFVLSPRAELDLIELWAYIAADDEAAADRFIELLHSKFQNLAATPGAG